jgi:hypothetical protein
MFCFFLATAAEARALAIHKAMIVAVGGAEDEARRLHLLLLLLDQYCNFTGSKEVAR